MWTKTVGGEKTVLTGKTIRGTRGAHKARDPAVDDAVLERCADRQYLQRCPVGEDVRGARVRVRIVVISFRKRIFKILFFYFFPPPYEKSVSRVRPTVCYRRRVNIMNA